MKKVVFLAIFWVLITFHLVSGPPIMTRSLARARRVIQKRYPTTDVIRKIECAMTSFVKFQRVAKSKIADFTMKECSVDFLTSIFVRFVPKRT